MSRWKRRRTACEEVHHLISNLDKMAGNPVKSQNTLEGLYCIYMTSGLRMTLVYPGGAGGFTVI